MLSIRKKYSLENDEAEALHKLWNSAYPISVAYSSLEKFWDYLLELQDLEHFLLVTSKGVICGWYFEFTREEERWFGIIISDKLQGKGWGKKLMLKAQAAASSLFGWVVDHDRDLKADGTLYRSPLQFYLSLGFELLEERFEKGTVSCAKIKWRKDENKE